MANTIKLKKDGSSGGEPTVNSNGSESSNGLAPGEVAINYRDGKLFLCQVQWFYLLQRSFPR